MAAVADHPLHHLTRFLSAADKPNLNYLLYSTVLLSILFPAYRFVLHDYQKFLDLGPGGTPSTFLGYLRVSCLRLFAIKNPFIPPSITATTLPQAGYLVRLPRRPGPRPIVAGIAPHRQTNQKGPPHLHAALSRALHNFAGTYPNLLRKGNSCFEKHGLALFLLTRPEHLAPTIEPHPGLTHVNPTCLDTAEICHLHATVSTEVLILPRHGRFSLFPWMWGFHTTLYHDLTSRDPLSRATSSFLHSNPFSTPPHPLPTSLTSPPT